jgi:hypothetical protein
MAAKILKNQEKSRIHYRINGVRQMTGSRRTEIELPDHLQKVKLTLSNICKIFD